MCQLLHLSVLHDVLRTIYYTRTKQTPLKKKYTFVFLYTEVVCCEMTPNREMMENLSDRDGNCWK